MGSEANDRLCVLAERPTAGEMRKLSPVAPCPCGDGSLRFPLSTGNKEPIGHRQRVTNLSYS
jgi:hypothetical protein